MEKQEKRKLASTVVARLSKFLRGKTFLGQKSAYGPFEVLVSTIISQRTRDENTDLASAKLFARYPTAKAIAAAKASEIAKLIRAAGFYNQKAREIKQVSKILVEEYGGVVPNSRELLEALPGVGPKTAGCVLVYGFGIPAIPVDTHVFRISHRLGLADAKAKTPEETEKGLEKVFDRKDWLVVNEYFVRLGQTVCRPIGPKCGECPLKDVCPTGRKNLAAENRMG
ncbi:MAG: endonuclease III [Candidatus Micrarchaeia archaeon]